MKSVLFVVEKSVYPVTPFLGVWIEIDDATEAIEGVEVTPFLGVWIEIGVIAGVITWLITSLPSWECGLKYDHISCKYIDLCHSLLGSVD